jgi:hypothetical protein
MKHILKWIGAIVGIVLLMGIAGFGWMAYRMNAAWEPKVSLDQYATIVAKRAESSERYSFLPRNIDPGAEKSAFYHIPGFLQGGDVICLRQKLPKSNIERLLNELKQSGRKEVTEFGNIPAPRCYPKYGITKPSGNNLFEDVAELPSGFRIFLFKSDLEDIQKNWNHNFLAFTAVSLEAGEVIYYVDRW